MFPRPAILLLLLCGPSTAAAQSREWTEVPLKSIWALSMPGTRNVRDLEPDHFGPRVRQLPEQQQIDLLLSSCSHQISDKIKRQTGQKPTGNGFVVQGSGVNALRNAKEWLAKGKTADQQLPEGTDVTLFFYSKEFGRYVHLSDVRRDRNTVIVSYKFVPHSTMTLDLNFALIPLGKLPTGKYRVNITRSLDDGRDDRHGNIVRSMGNEEKWEQYVCKPFSFKVIPTNQETEIPD